MNPRSAWESGLGRFEEVESEDGSFRGGPLPDAVYRKGQYPVNDELFLGSGDAAIDAHFGGPRIESYDELSYSEAYGDTDEDDFFNHSGVEATSVALRDDDEELLQRALDSIRRAKEQGRSVVDMGVEELTALERSRKQRTLGPTKSSKGRKMLALSGSGTVKSKKQRGSGQSTTSSPSGKSKPLKPSKRGSGSTDDGPRSPYASVFGFGSGSGSAPLQTSASSGGVPVHQAVTHYRTSSQSGSRPSSRHSTRSASQGNRLQRTDTPPYDAEPTTPPIPSSHPRYFSAPTSDAYPSYPPSYSSPRRELEDWQLHHNRARSSSSAVAAAAAAGFYPPLYEQDASVHPGYPALQGSYGYNANARRSGPEITYASLRRVPPSLGIGGSSSGSGGRERPGQGAGGMRMSSDPMMAASSSMAHRARDGDGSPMAASFSSDEEGGSGVLVNVLPEGQAGGYSVVHGGGSGGSGGGGNGSANSGAGASAGASASGSGTAPGKGGRRRKKR